MSGRTIEIRVESGKKTRCYVASLKDEASTCVFDFSARRVISDLVETTAQQHNKTIKLDECRVLLIDEEWTQTQFATVTEFFESLDEERSR